MDKLLKIAIVALFCSGLCAASQRKPAQKAPPQKPSAATPAPATPVAAPVVPQAPPTPENMPAKAPQVSLSNGMLSIVAENSTLGDVLNGIHKATGASVDIPPAATAERVVVNIGPTEPRDALQQLLSGSKFDYIIVGSPENDAALEKVILTARSGAAASGPAAVAANRPPAYQPPPPQPNYEPPADEDNNGEDAGVNSYQPEPSPEVTLPPQPPNGQPGQPGQVQQQEQQNQQGPKTPEQLLQQLQQMRGQQSDQNQRPDRNPQEE